MNNNQDPRMNNGGYDPLGEPQVRRTYTPEEAGHEKHRKPVTRASYNTRRRRRPSVNWAVVLITLIFVVVIGICLFLLISGLNRRSPGNEAIDPTVPTETTEAVTTEDPLPYEAIEIPENQIYFGNLILVNSYNEYVFPEEMEGDIVTIESEKTENYRVSGYSSSIAKTTIDAFNKMTEDCFTQTGFSYLQINSAYRSHEDQVKLYAQYEQDYGADYAKSYVATPGFSEHHTGLGVDLNVNVNGSIYYVESYEDCWWFRENCQKYGFILRYPDDKVHMTGISYESWHYRYVGTPHAQIMEDINFCLEEYIDYLKSYTYDGICLGYKEETGAFDITPEEFYEAEGVTMIYYVPAEEKFAKALVPKDCEYTVSGNNVDGFVITCVK